MPARVEEALLLVILLGAASSLAMLVALWMAFRSRKPASRRPRRRSFEHGRHIARESRPFDAEGALAALARSPVGRVTHVDASGERVVVSIARARGQTCTQAAGYLAGLFESAWAHEVLVTHPSCGGEREGTCEYVIQRAPIGNGAREAGASTRGSEAGRRRSPRARAGAS